MKIAESLPLKIGATILSVVATALSGCGPMLLSKGVADLSKRGTSTVIVLVLVNDSGEAIHIDLLGSRRDGSVFTQPFGTLPPFSSAQVSVDELASVRVRAREEIASIARPSVTWDLDLRDPADGTTCALDVEDVVMSSVRASGTQPDRFDLQRLVDAPGGGLGFAQVGTTDLMITPDLVAIHPSGGYLYTLEDLGGGNGEVRAYRLNAANGEVEFIEPEFGRFARNPLTVRYDAPVANLRMQIEPRGRALYLIEVDAAADRSILQAFPVESDGSLGAVSTGVRGEIGDLEFRADGAVAYLTERAVNAFFVKELLVDQFGLLGQTTSEAQTPCATNAPGQLAIHPSGRFLYCTVEMAGTVRVGSYLTAPNSRFVLVEDECSDFDTIVDLTIESTGQFLYATGTVGGAERVVRYRIDQLTGQLVQFDGSQDLGSVSTLTTTADPRAPPGSTRRDVVYVAIDDRLVPHSVAAGGALEPVPGTPALPFGSPSSTRLVQGTMRGTAKISIRQ